MLRMLTLAMFAASALVAQVVYIPNQSEGTISMFVYDAEDGGLTELLPRITAGGTPNHVAIHPSGRFALVANGGRMTDAPNLAVYTIDPVTGMLRFASRAPLPLGSNPTAVAVDSGGGFAFVSHGGVMNGASAMSVFALNRDRGVLTLVPGSPFTTPANLTSTVVHPNGKFVYASAAGPGQVVAYSIGTNGAITAIEGSPFAARTMMPWMAMDREGKFLFAAEREGRGILVYSVNATTGGLTPVAGSPFSTGNLFPIGLAVHPAGNLLTVPTGSTSVLSYSISASGALQPRPTQQVGVGTNSVVFDPGGKFVFLSSGQLNSIATYSVDADTGTLTDIGPPSPTGAFPFRGAAVVLDPLILPPMRLSGVVNQSSRSAYGGVNAGIAQGSLMGIMGTNIGPAEPVDKPEGITVEIRSGDTVVPAIVVYATQNEVRAVAPSSTPTGEARLTLTYKGRTSNAVPLHVVPVSPGVRSNTHTGYGPAAAWNVPPDTPITLDESLTQIRNRFVTPARPGQTMVVAVTGLGAVDADETTEFVQEIGREAEVVVGHKTATVLAKSRTYGGQDYIVFRLPQDVPTGCYVPILVRAGGVQSNVPSISISPSGEACSDSAGLSSSDVEASERTGTVNVGVIQLNRLGFEDEGEVSEIRGRFVQYTRENFRNSFASTTADIGLRSGFAVPPPGTCTVTPVIAAKDLELDPDRTPALRINAGPALNVSTPSGDLRLAAPNYSFESETRQFEPGDYSVDNGAGVEPMGAWKGSLTLPPQVQWTNRAALTSLNRREDLVVTWSGGLADKEIVIVGGFSQDDHVSAAFACAERVAAGRLTIPSWVFANLPASSEVPNGAMSSPAGVLGLITVPVSSVGRFTARGLGLGLFTYEQGGFKFVRFR